MAGCHRQVLGLFKLIRTTPRQHYQACQVRQLWMHQHSGPISSAVFDYRSSTAQTRCSLYPRLQRDSCFIQYRNILSSIPNCSEDQKTKDTVKSKDKTAQKPEEKLSVFQRFKKTYKEHGKVLIVVHLITSTVWFGTFFYAASVGVDVIAFMEWIGLSEKIISPFRSSSLGNIALAYLMYKLATPARYTVTLTGTNFAIKYLRKAGKMQPKMESSSLRSLARDSRTELKEKQRNMKRKTSKMEARMKSRVKDEINKRQVYVKATFTKFRSKLREKNKKIGKNGKNGKQYPWRR